MDFASYWKQRQKVVDRALQKALPSPKTRPATVHEAMRYSMFAGGKRLRPVLCLAAAEAVSGSYQDALPLACAVECVHTYSLIHDDLPCMDDDDLRRGMPTSHKVYGEGVAVLAGDALLTLAFELAASVRGWKRYGHRDVVLELARAAGSRALVGGQVMDLEMEGKPVTLAQLRFIHENKTGALITASIRLGAMAADAPPAQLAALTVFGRHLGLAFQIIDDILDITESSTQLGKSAGKDLTAHKATYPALMGLDKARKEAARLTRRALEALRPFGKKAAHLEEIAHYLLDRKY